MKIKFFATYRDITHKKEEDVPAPKDVWNLLQNLSESYGDTFRSKLISPDGQEINEHAIILVNGYNVVHLKDKNTALAETDIVSLFPVVAGG